ncbi:FAD-dependent monooxygenase [Streptomyces sp. NPDC051020]|uniref:FAD-dependent monooxygenase n=1 Tax=Streptomyces sp. NPDC051020 TaxID=3155409 RepID=UPI00343BF83A
MHSTVQRLAFGPEAEFFRHKDRYFAFADSDAALGEDRWVTMFNTPGHMAGIYHRDLSVHKRLVSEAFGHNATWRTRELLDSALADPEFYFDALAQVHMRSWSNGRVTLVGDAAWCASPASGAGAELALVGAYRLAGELATAGGDHHKAFARYEAAQRPLVDKKQQIGPNVRLMVPKTAGGKGAASRTGVRGHR